MEIVAPAPLGRRVSAYLLDWLVSLVAAAMAVALAAGLLLCTSDLDRRDPPDWSLYVAMIVVSLWLPAWFLYTTLAWSAAGRTLGMAMTGVSVVAARGAAAGILRAAGRTILLALLSAPLLLSPALLAIFASLGTVEPLWLSIPLACSVAGSTLACASPFLASDRVAWHDRITGTRVVIARQGGVAG